MRGLRIGVSVEHVRAWGRRVCEGVALFSKSHRDWAVTLLDENISSVGDLRKYDGLICCVTDCNAANKLIASGRPFVDLTSDCRYAGKVYVGANHVLCGQLAAQHFIARHFKNFAFFGWRGLRFSESRARSFVRSLRCRGFACAQYLSPERNIRHYLNQSVLRERLKLPGDARQVAAWLRRLPKPVGVFCANDLRAWQLGEICRQNGLAVPGEIAILGADNDSIPCLLTSPALSSVDTDTVKTGWQAAETLDRILRGRRRRDDVRPILVTPRGVEARESTAVYPLNPPWLSEALMFIRNQVSKGLLASDVVAHVGLSYPTVENAFRSELKTTIQKEIMAARLETAERLLVSGDLSLSEIGRQAGFRTPQYFSSCFRAAYGVSPGEWRERPRHRV